MLELRSNFLKPSSASERRTKFATTLSCLFCVTCVFIGQKIPNWPMTSTLSAFWDRLLTSAVLLWRQQRKNGEANPSRSIRSNNSCFAMIKWHRGLCLRWCGGICKPNLRARFVKSLKHIVITILSRTCLLSFRVLLSVRLQNSRAWHTPCSHQFHEHNLEYSLVANPDTLTKKDLWNCEIKFFNIFVSPRRHRSSSIFSKR